MKQALRAELLAMRVEDVATRSRLAELGLLDDDNYHPELVDARRVALDLWSQQEHPRHLQQDYDSNQANRKKTARTDASD